MRFLPGNAQHIGDRHSQQDSFGFADPDDQEFLAHGGFLAIVCDGMGGMEYGDAASRTAVRAFLDAYARKTPAESIPDALERSVREANAQVVALAHSLGMSEGIGTTLVATALHDHSLYFISVGDSGIFLCANGQFRMMNRLHIFANLLDAAVARGSLSREDAQNHPERESLTSFIGAENLEEIDRNADPIPLSPGDTVLLASDGMFKTLDAQEIAASLQGPPQTWPDALVERTIAKKREHQDNVTVVSVTLDGDRAFAPAAPPRTVVLKPPPPETTPVPPPAASTPPRSSFSWWPILVIVIVAVAAAGWWFMKHRAPGAINTSPAITAPAQTQPASPNLTPEDKADPNVRRPAGSTPSVGSSAPVQVPGSPTPTPTPSGVPKK